MNYRGLHIKPVQMGAVSSDDLFEEQEIFDLYERLKTRYRKALDIGANIGIHALLMAKQCWQVLAYEPDPRHYELLLENLRNNPSEGLVMAHNSAVSTQAGIGEFVLVLGNTTASHLEGSRGHHGDVEKFQVALTDCRPLFDWADFAKIDVEGHEARLVCAATPEQLSRLDLLVEVGSVSNAQLIYHHCRESNVDMWAQKTGWGKVEVLRDVPTHYSQGMLFIGRQP